MKAPKCRSCGEMHWGSAPCSAAFVADTPTVARVRLRDAVAKVPAKKAPKAVTKKTDAGNVTKKTRGRPQAAKPLTGAERVMMYRMRQGALVDELANALKALLGQAPEYEGMAYSERVALAKAALAKVEGGK